MGEEPRPALIIKLIPTAFVNSPMVNSVYLLTVSFFDIFITFLFGGKIKQFFFGKFIAKFQSLLSVRVRFATFAGMNQQREFRKSEEPFYFVCYDKPTQKELYERNYKLIKVAEGGTITLSCCGETLTAKEGDYLFVNRGGFSKIRILPGKSGRFRLLCLNLTEKFLKTYAQNNLIPVYSCSTSFYSRIPVYAETRDNIKGVLYIKDLLPHLNKGDNFRWQSLIRPAYFVPETKMIDDLLRDFQANKIHIAIVVDEFGGTSGIVTMEDIIEEIVGEIRDEYDDEERTYAVLNDHTWVFEAKTQLTDFYKITKIDEETFDEVAGDADTLAGLLLELKGEFPALHEKVTYGYYEFEVLEMDNRRILKVKFTINEPVREGSETEK